MHATRSALAAAAVMVVFVPAGCSSGARTSGATATSPASSPAPRPGGGSEVAAMLARGLRGLTSAHLAIAAGAIGGTSQGDFAFADGKATAADLQLVQAGATVEIITIGTTSYAKLPSGQNTTGKPWITVRADSKNEFVRGLSPALVLNQAVASLGDIVHLIATAGAVQEKGSETIGGVRTQHYRLRVVATGGANSSGLEQELALLGTKRIPIDLDLDRAGRPVRIAVALPLNGQTFTVTVTGSKFNAPVHISAPPAGQISTD